MDSILDSKYNPITSKVEIHRYKWKAPTPELNPNTRRVQEATVLKLTECILSIIANFRSIKKFLQTWMETSEPKLVRLRDGFIKNGTMEVIDTWLSMVKIDLNENSKIIEMVVGACEKEVSGIMKQNMNPLCYNKLLHQLRDTGIFGSLCSSLDDIKIFLHEYASIS